MKIPENATNNSDNKMDSRVMALRVTYFHHPNVEPDLGTGGSPITAVDNSMGDPSTIGQYAHFSARSWSTQIGSTKRGKDGQGNTHVYQVRGKTIIWSGNMTIWPSNVNTSAVVGRRTSHWAPRQWQKGDTIFVSAADAFKTAPGSLITDVVSESRHPLPMGQYAHFSARSWSTQIGSTKWERDIMTIFNVYQVRGTTIVWSGNMTMWPFVTEDAVLHVTGGRTSGSAPGQWQKGDILFAHVADAIAKINRVDDTNMYAIGAASSDDFLVYNRSFQARHLFDEALHFEASKQQTVMTELCDKYDKTLPYIEEACSCVVNVDNGFDCLGTLGVLPRIRKTAVGTDPVTKASNAQLEVLAAIDKRENDDMILNLFKNNEAQSETQMKRVVQKIIATIKTESLKPWLDSIHETQKGLVSEKHAAILEIDRIKKAIQTLRESIQDMSQEASIATADMKLDARTWMDEYKNKLHQSVEDAQAALANCMEEAEKKKKAQKPKFFGKIVSFAKEYAGASWHITARILSGMGQLMGSNKFKVSGEAADAFSNFDIGKVGNRYVGDTLSTLIDLTSKVARKVDEFINTVANLSESTLDDLSDKNALSSLFKTIGVQAHLVQGVRDLEDAIKQKIDSWSQKFGSMDKDKIPDLKAQLMAVVTSWRDPSNGKSLDDYAAIGERIRSQIKFDEVIGQYADNARDMLQSNSKKSSKISCPESAESEQQAAKAKAALEAAMNLQTALKSMVKTCVAVQNHGVDLVLYGKAPVTHMMYIDFAKAQSKFWCISK